MKLRLQCRRLKRKAEMNGRDQKGISELNRSALARPVRPLPLPLWPTPGLVGRLLAAHLGLRGCVLVERVEGRLQYSQRVWQGFGIHRLRGASMQ